MSVTASLIFALFFLLLIFAYLFAVKVFIDLINV